MQAHLESETNKFKKISSVTLILSWNTFGLQLFVVVTGVLSYSVHESTEQESKALTIFLQTSASFELIVIEA